MEGVLGIAMSYSGHEGLQLGSFSPPAFELSGYAAIDEGPITVAAGELEKLLEDVGDSDATGLMMGRGNEKKRMKVDVGCRIGFRMKSEVEILDDGYKWRKYGKKSVKNSPNPRNYYRCSTEGCGVKKRVERDREDPGYVVTTYEGVHNHPTPAVFPYIYTPAPYNPTAWISCGGMV